MRKLKTVWHPVILSSVFLLGIITGTFAGLQQTGVMGSIRQKVHSGDSKVAVLDQEEAFKVSNGATSRKSGSKVKGASTTAAIGGITPAAQVRFSTACGTSAAKHANLVSAAMEQLKKLAEYEDVCGNAFASKVSFFVGLPANTQDVNDQAQWVADTLKEIASRGLSPLVFMEPTVNGDPINLTTYRDDAHVATLRAYFSALKAKGVTDATMGTWVPMPESNIPVWNNTSPTDFAADVTVTAQAQKQVFPGSRVAVLLQTMTYADANWEKGSYVSLKPYVQGIPKGLVDSFGMQGFPWPPTDPSDSPQLDPKKFIRTDFAKEAADVLGAKEIFFNTGTFAKSYVVSKTNPFILTPQQRQAILDGILAQAKVLKNQGFSVAVHMFNEDKSATDEKIDWSYWPKGQAAASPNTAVFKTFISDANAAGVGIWMFDSN